ncbi:CbtA family protein [Gordonia sp. CPCC 206044]|uniref:CbtA family protein n=1 Tax=Gordonia sp. CPCC 206044 TaxID=3140793 RepID=UPI003AF3BA6C
MEKKFIGAGLLSGLIAGIVAYLFARLFIEPQVSEAIDYEEARSHAEEMLAGHDHGAHEHGELFSRSVQENVGAGVGTIVFAVCMGAFFAVAFTVLWAYLGRRYPATDPRMVAGALGAIGFVAVFAVPFFAYPANPPAVGDDDTIGARSGAFLTITVLSVVFAIAAVVLALWLRPRIGGLLGGVAAALGYLVAVAVTIALLPEFDEVPGPLMNGEQIAFPGFPGDVVGDFRLYAIANQVILWTILTVVFALVLGLLMRAERTGSAADSEKLSA